MSDFHEEFGDEELRERPPIEMTLALLSSEDGFDAQLFYGLAELTSREVEQLRPVWENLAPDYRRKVMQRVVDIAETNFDLDYSALGLLSLDDRDPEVRTAAVEVLWENESPELMDRLIELAQWDESVQVRAAAASALGNFVLLGELGDLDAERNSRVQDAVISLLTDRDEDADVRRRALESIANSSHEIVNEAIIDSYESGDTLMRASAIFAMGRTCDRRWRDMVLREIDSADPEVRYEAARASGALELQEAIPTLMQLASGDEREIQEVSIWALGEIGGSSAMRALGRLAEAAEEEGDEELQEAIEEAIGSASLVGSDMLPDFDED